MIVSLNDTTQTMSGSIDNIHDTEFCPYHQVQAEIGGVTR